MIDFTNLEKYIQLLIENDFKKIEKKVFIYFGVLYTLEDINTLFSLLHKYNLKKRRIELLFNKIVASSLQKEFSDDVMQFEIICINCKQKDIKSFNDMCGVIYFLNYLYMNSLKMDDENDNDVILEQCNKGYFGGSDGDFLCSDCVDKFEELAEQRRKIEHEKYLIEQEKQKIEYDKKHEKFFRIFNEIDLDSSTKKSLLYYFDHYSFDENAILIFYNYCKFLSSTPKINYDFMKKIACTWKNLGVKDKFDAFKVVCSYFNYKYNGKIPDMTKLFMDDILVSIFNINPQDYNYNGSFDKNIALLNAVQE